MNPSTHRTWVRPAAVAGTFYPDDPTTLRQLVRYLLAQAIDTLGSEPQTAKPPKAIVAPHAGYIYSGPIAASAYARLAVLPEPQRQAIRRVVLVGPSHRVGFDGLATSSADAFATPLGEVRVDRESVAELERVGVWPIDRAHEKEHCLEVHLPFLLESLGPHIAIVPMLVGQAGRHDVALAIDAVWGGPETLIVVSSDLSHYNDYESAKAIDRAASAAIESLRAGELLEHQACGRLAIQGVIEEALRHHLSARTVDLRNSGDTAGSRDRVVGYGAFVFA